VKKRSITAVAVATLSLLGVACGGDPDTSTSVQQASAVPTIPSSTTTTTLPPTTTTTAYVAPPALTIICPDGHAPYVGKPGRWGFGTQWQWSTASATLAIDYGDGHNYLAHGVDDMKKAALWHNYERPGTYTVNAMLTDDLERTASSSCTLDWVDTLAQAVGMMDQAMKELGVGSSSSGGTSSLGGGSLSGCYFHGKQLWGKVKVVDSFADIKVQVVNSFPDLKVKEVNSFPTSCGEWQIVDSFPDFTVQFVNSFPDIKVELVNSFPGL
jgi:hypothetical protein